MKAVYATGTNYDDPLSVLEVGTMPEPETKPFWSTIRVNSASVNHHDVWSLQGVGLSDEQTPMILGTDAAGVLEEDIPVRKGLKAGSEVVLYTFVGTDGAGDAGGETLDPVRTVCGNHGRIHTGAQRQRVRQARESES